MEFQNVRIVTPGSVIPNGALVTEGERIVQITATAGAPSGLTLLPGFIDLHIHGGGGGDVMDATPAALTALATTHAAHGTTRLLATTMTQSRPAITAALAAVAAYRGPVIAGIHLEGPYLSAKKPGAQPREFVRPYDAAEFADWLAVSQGGLRQITLASEEPGANDLIALCHQNNIVVSLGHTDASAAQAREAIEHGARQATHLFNAMNGIHHRAPGPIPVFLTDPRVRVEMIADGHHVAPEVIAMVYAAVGPTRLIAITDAMAGAGAGEGAYALGGHTVTVADGKATLADGTLAGSVLTMDQAARNLREWCGLSWDMLARVTATNAADQMGWHETGRIADGALADLTLVDDALTVHATYARGTCVYTRQ